MTESAPAPAPPRPRMFRPREYQGRVHHKVWHAPDLLEIGFALEGEQMFEFHPGQYLSILLDGDSRGEVRPYSLWNHPRDEGAVPTTILRIIPGGRASTLLGSIAVGEPLRFVAPVGVFFLRDPLPQHLYLVGTGTGVVPLRSMLRELWERGAGGRSVSLYFGARHEADLFHLDEFRRMEAEQPGFRFVPTLTRPGPSWEGARGRVTEHFRAMDLPASDMHAYLCGSGAMIDEMTDLLLARGVDRKAVVREKYFD